MTPAPDRKSTRLNSSHSQISYAVFCLKKKIASFRPCSETQICTSVSRHFWEFSWFSGSVSQEEDVHRGIPHTPPLLRISLQKRSCSFNKRIWQVLRQSRLPNWLTISI